MLDKILNTISFIAGLGFIVSVSCIDSEGQIGNIAVLIAAACLTWLLIFLYIRGK